MRARQDGFIPAQVLVEEVSLVAAEQEQRLLVRGLLVVFRDRFDGFPVAHVPVLEEALLALVALIFEDAHLLADLAGVLEPQLDLKIIWEARVLIDLVRREL